MQDLNLGGSMNLKNFTKTMNIVSDKDMQLGGLEAYCTPIEINQY